MNAPKYLVRKAFLEGINNGRQGEGSIYVFASGNVEGMKTSAISMATNSIYSVTVGAVDRPSLDLLGSLCS